MCETQAAALEAKKHLVREGITEFLEIHRVG
jgi:hypothetical protein